MNESEMASARGGDENEENATSIISIFSKAGWRVMVRNGAASGGTACDY